MQNSLIPEPIIKEIYKQRFFNTDVIIEPFSWIYEGNIQDHDTYSIHFGGDNTNTLYVVDFCTMCKTEAQMSYNLEVSYNNTGYTLNFPVANDVDFERQIICEALTIGIDSGDGNSTYFHSAVGWKIKQRG